MKAYLTLSHAHANLNPEQPPKAGRSKKSIYKEKKSLFFLCRIEIIFYFCSVKNDNDQIGLWCNGNTTDSGPVIPGSNPGSPTKSFLKKRLFFCIYTDRSYKWYKYYRSYRKTKRVCLFQDKLFLFGIV